jgi:hypothetical protein
MKTDKLYIYFLSASILTFLYGFIGLNDSILDININDGFYVGGFIFSNFYSLVLLIISLAFFLFHKLKFQLNSMMTKIHLFNTIGIFFLFWIINTFLKLLGGSHFSNLTRNILYSSVLLISFTFQLIYFIYIINVNFNNKTNA